jgi:cytochrome P450
MDRDVESKVASVPPGPRAHHTVQALEWIRRPVRFLERGRRRYGPIFTARFGPNHRAVFVSDPVAVRDVITGDPDELRMGDANGLFRPAVGPSSILLLDGEEHLRHRRLMLPAFTRSHTELFAETIEEVTLDRLERWPIGTPFLIQPEMEEIAFTTILRMVFGLEAGLREERIRDLFPQMMDMCDRVVNLLPWFRHEVGGHSPWGRLMGVIAELDDVLRAEIRDRRTDPAVETRNDLLSLLCRARNADGNFLTDSELRDELMTMLMAGQETTSAALAWAFERLLRNPRPLGRLMFELAGGGEEYLDAVIREVLRQRPPIPVMARKLAAPMRLGDYRIPAGWVVMPSIYLLHREPDVFPRPDEFIPERFLTDQSQSKAWVPFGGGVRRCLGANLAQLEMKVVLRTVLPRVRLLAPSPTSEPIRRRRFAFSPAKDALAILAERLPGPAPQARPREPAAEPRRPAAV